VARRTAILKLTAILAIGAIAGCAPAASVTPAARSFAPPVSTPLAEPPAEPAGDGTTATLSTELGDIVVELFNESSPVAAENFVDLAEAGFYDGVIFHRVIPGFVIQGGDPTGSGSGGPGYTIRDEPVVGDYERGVLAMARPANRDGSPMPDSAGSQFFIILDDLRQQLPEDGRYQIFGRVASGMEVVDGIAAGATDPSTDRPLDPVAINSVAIDRP
jgi:cyclophilin family peptidyl-prolyl cis-trans isomerase